MTNPNIVWLKCKFCYRNNHSGTTCWKCGKELENGLIDAQTKTADSRP